MNGPTNEAPATAAAAARPANRLAREKSPYLLQHAHNPVDWFPWGPEAFARARAEQKPIFLSIGYSTCHWCHVMERESFEDAAVGRYLNEHFVSIKLDREERPDVDKIYMTFVQSATGGGGWPLNVFLTPDLQPFYGGTYFPPESRYGRPSFRQLLERIVELWGTRRADLVESARDTTERLRGMASHDPDNAFPAGERELHGAGQTFLTEYDPAHGGFGGAPKFPRPSVPLFLLRHGSRFQDPQAFQAAVHTADAMAAGGMNDQLGGGFARYSVDERWLVPHFEKMLYDQAQLVTLYLDVFQLRGGEPHAAAARETLRYVLRDMTHPEGGFFSAEDADSEGKEGKFYCWTLAEFKALLTPEELAAAVRHFGVGAQGNFHDHSDPDPLPGQNVLSIADPKLSDSEQAWVASARSKLLTARARRVRPHRDDKVLTSWNGMMLGAFARAGVILGQPEFTAAARRNLAFLRQRMWEPATGTLHSRWRDGHRDDVQLLDAYANLLAGVTDLYEATLDPDVLQFAVDLAESMMLRFHDAKAGGFWQTAEGAPDLLMRSKDDYDGAEPSGNSVAALALLRLAAICDRKDWREAAEKTLRLFAQRLHQTPHAVPHLLLALDFVLQEPRRVVLAGDPASDGTATLLQAVHSVFQPHRVVLGHQGPVDPFARTLLVGKEHTQAFCCTGTACQPPTRDREAVRQFLTGAP
ncbi:MAG: thioredoxin domain-containing protein [Verrucomicrobia bacterium]|nr:thioredoxin domain-containing protein [Verrucomicrobiota bacterium]